LGICFCLNSDSYFLYYAIVYQNDMLSKDLIKNIEEGIADIEAGRVYTSEQVKKKLGLK